MIERVRAGVSECVSEYRSEWIEEYLVAEYFLHSSTPNISACPNCRKFPLIFGTEY